MNPANPERPDLDLVSTVDLFVEIAKRCDWAELRMRMDRDGEVTDWRRLRSVPPLGRPSRSTPWDDDERPKPKR